MAERPIGDLDLSRRTFVKTTGAAVGAGTVGVGAAGTGAAAATDVDERLLNWRTVEARKVWAKGYRGRPDRSLGLTDSGVSARHAELGPWNDVVFQPSDDGTGIELKESTTRTEELPVPTTVEDRTETFANTNVGTGAFGLIQDTPYFTLDGPGAADGETSKTTVEQFSESGTIGPGGPREANAESRQTSREFVPAELNTTDQAVDQVDATLTWSPANQDVELLLERATGDDGWEQVAASRSGNITTGEGERLVTDVDPTARYRFVVETWITVQAEWELSVDLVAVDRTDGSGGTLEELVDPGFEIAATLSWNTDHEGPQHAAVEMVLQDGDGNAIASAGDTSTSVSEDNTASLSAEIPAGEYRFQVTTWRGVAQWEIDAVVFFRKKQYDENGDLVTEPREVRVLEDYEGGDPLPAADVDVTTETPKVVGWYDPSGDLKAPRDANGHGSHVSGIMTGTGRGSTVDRADVHRPNAYLLPTDFLEYEVEVPSTGTVFASALGTNVVVEIVGPGGEVVHETPLREDSVIADEPAVHGSGRATYTVRVKPYETGGSGVRAYDGNPTAAILETIAIGTYASGNDTTGARTAGNTSVHPGLAPNASLVGLQGLSAPTNDLNDLSDDLAARFNLRAMNMSWGPSYGIPVGQFGGELDPVFNPIFAGNVDADETLNAVETAAENGILTVAAAGNFFTPANGNGFPAIADEAISVVATGPLDGITGYSAGGLGGVDEDNTTSEVYLKPDVTAPGGDAEPDAAGAIVAASTGAPYPVPSRFELVRSVRAAEPGSDQETFEPRDFASIGGTSMASPYVCGMAGLVAQAMEEDAPEPIALPAPAELAAMDDAEALTRTMRLKQVILATANETAFTAAPYHSAKTVPSPPTYQHGDRDPYEGYGRANPDAAVDAVTRDLLASDPQLGGETHDASHEESVGLYVPEDSRVAAGYVRVPGGTLDASVDFTDYGGANRGMAAGSPHLDLFVYDAESPAAQGEPNIVASAQGRQGSASVSVSVDRGSRDDPTERTLYVVAKMVNVPGVVNGFDVRANFDLDVSFSPADEFPPVTTAFSATGSRSDDGDVFTAGQTNEVKVTISGFQHAEEVAVRDQVPASWSVDERFGDVDSYDAETGVVHLDGTVTADQVAGDGSVTFTYFAEAPSGADGTGQYPFGPAEAAVVTPDVPEEDSDGDLEGTVDSFGGTDTNTVVGASSETSL